MPSECCGIDINHIVLVFSLWENLRGEAFQWRFVLRNTLRVFNVCIYTTNILHKFNLKNDADVQFFPICSWSSTRTPVKLILLLMEEIPSNHPGCVKPWEKKRDKLPLVFSQDFWTINAMGFHEWPQTAPRVRLVECGVGDLGLSCLARLLASRQPAANLKELNLMLGEWTPGSLEIPA